MTPSDIGRWPVPRRNYRRGYRSRPNVDATEQLITYLTVELARVAERRQARTYDGRPSVPRVGQIRDQVATEDRRAAR